MIIINQLYSNGHFGFIDCAAWPLTINHCKVRHQEEKKCHDDVCRHGTGLDSNI
jgi:hypothetical protein